MESKNKKENENDHYLLYLGIFEKVVLFHPHIKHRSYICLNQELKITEIVIILLYVDKDCIKEIFFDILNLFREYLSDSVSS